MSMIINVSGNQIFVIGIEFIYLASDTLSLSFYRLTCRNGQIYCLNPAV